MPSISQPPPSLSEDTVDDILYAARAGDAPFLTEALSGAATEHACDASAVLAAAVAPESGNTALHYAAANGHDGILSSILAQSPNELINLRNAAGNTALHWAALNGKLGCVKALVSAGADMWVRNAAGNLAIFEAERAEKDDVVTFLLVEGGGKEDEKTGEAAADRADEADGEEEVEIARVQMGDMSVEQ